MREMAEYPVAQAVVLLAPVVLFLGVGFVFDLGPAIIAGSAVFAVAAASGGIGLLVQLGGLGE